MGGGEKGKKRYRGINVSGITWGKKRRGLPVGGVPKDMDFWWAPARRKGLWEGGVFGGGGNGRLRDAGGKKVYHRRIISTGKEYAGGSRWGGTCKRNRGNLPRRMESLAHEKRGNRKSEGALSRSAHEQGRGKHAFSYWKRCGLKKRGGVS